jgi:5-dehydro-2-deoxygluconokinase
MTLTRIKQNNFLVFGRAGLDLYADPPETEIETAGKFSSALGGSAANIAAGITRLGGHASLVSAISNDAVGRYITNQLKKYDIGADYVKLVGGESRSSLAVVETRPENCQSVIYRNGAADFQMTEAQVRAIAFERFGAVIVTGTCLAIEPSRGATFVAIELARKAGLTVILDVDYRPYSWISAADAAETYARLALLCDIVIGNDEEFSVMTGGGDGPTRACTLAATTAEIVVYKMGEKGSTTYCNDEIFETGIYPVAALKPTGAGDAFMAAFVTGLASGADLQNCVNRGSAAAAIVVTKVGCAPAMPNAAELQHFISTHSL